MTGKRLVVRTAGPEETRAAGRALGISLEGGYSFSLEGPLGAGKTVFAAGMCDGLGISGPVTSPTFTLQNEYRGESDLRVIHMDCFRLQSAAEFEDLGVTEELDEDTVLIVEWGERALAALPPDVIRIEIEVTGEEERRIAIQVPEGVELAVGPSGEEGA